MTQLVWPNGTTTEPARTDGYGPRPSMQTKAGLTRPFHAGTDHHSIGVLRAIGDGTVIESGWIGWAGYYVLIYLGEIDGVRTWVRYCHLRAPSHLGRGDTVRRGEQIGYEGDTGQAGGVHLHWEIYRGRVDRGDWDDPGATVDPRAFVRARLTLSTPGTGEKEDEDMDTRQLYATPSKRRALFVPGTAYFVPWVEGGSTYANRFATGLETGSAIQVTDSLFDALKRGAAAMLPKDRVAVEVVEVEES